MKPEATMNRTVEYKADTKMKQYTLSKCIVGTAMNTSVRGPNTPGRPHR